MTLESFEDFRKVGTDDVALQGELNECTFEWGCA